MKVKRFFSLVIGLFAIMFIVSCESMTTDLQKAKALQKDKEYGKSIALLEGVRQKNANNREVNYLLGVAYLNVEETEKARRIFDTAISAQEDAEKKERLVKDIAMQYRDVFYLYLTKVTLAERQKAKIFFDTMLTYYTGSDMIDGMKKYLEEKGIKYLNNYTLDMADGHFVYLFKLDKGSGKTIANAYVSAFQQGGDDEYLAMLVDRAIGYSQDKDIQKAYSDYYFGLSKKTEITEKALDYLEKANKNGHLYDVEFAAKKEQLKEEKFLEVVKKYESQWGPAKIVKLTEANKWIPVCTIQNKQRIDYLSMHKFKKKDNFNNENTWEEAISQKYGYRITGSQDLHIEFKMYEKPTIIYYWVNNS